MELGLQDVEVRRLRRTLDKLQPALVISAEVATSNSLAEPSAPSMITTNELYDGSVVAAQPTAASVSAQAQQQLHAQPRAEYTRYNQQHYCQPRESPTRLSMGGVKLLSKVRKVSDAGAVGVVAKKHETMDMVQVDFAESGGPKYKWIKITELVADADGTAREARI